MAHIPNWRIKEDSEIDNVADESKRRKDDAVAIELNVSSFEEMNLNPMLLKGIQAFGYTNPLDIQRRVFIPCINGQDVIIQSPPKTGKTTAFSIAILQKLKSDKPFCQALILVPFRDLAQQINKNILNLGEFIRVTCHASIGGSEGMKIREEKKKLENGVQIVVGTPGRVLDMIKRGSLKLEFIQMFVIDVADELFHRFKKEELEKIFAKLNTDVQIILSSAEMPSDVLEASKTFMKEPVHIVGKIGEPDLERINQFQSRMENSDQKVNPESDPVDTLPIEKPISYSEIPPRMERFIKLKKDLVPSNQTEKAEIKNDEPEKVELEQIVISFEDMNLNPNVLKGIYLFGFENPLEIQKRVIVPCISGQRIIIQAPPQTGKTTAFSIAILQNIKAENPFCQALILVPFRELAQQINKNILALGKYAGVTCHACVGGSDVGEEKKILENGIQIVVGTPGRVFDLIRRGSLQTESIQMFAVDVADMMLRKQFKGQFDKIYTKLKGGVQTILSCAKMPRSTEETKELMNDAVHIVQPPQTTTLTQSPLH